MDCRERAWFRGELARIIMLRIAGPKVTPWVPIKVGPWRAFLSRHLLSTKDFVQSRIEGIINNIIYSLQHLEFIDRCNKDLALTPQIKIMNQKMFIVEGCSIVEALLFYLLIIQKRAPKTEWKVLRLLDPIEFAVGSEVVRQITTVYTKSDEPFPKVLRFVQMLEIAEKIEGFGNEFHKNMRYLKELRNKVHLQGPEKSTDADYLTISEKDMALMKGILLSLFKSPLFKSGAGMPAAVFLKA